MRERQLERARWSEACETGVAQFKNLFPRLFFIFSGHYYYFTTLECFMCLLCAPAFFSRTQDTNGLSLGSGSGSGSELRRGWAKSEGDIRYTICIKCEKERAVETATAALPVT